MTAISISCNMRTKVCQFARFVRKYMLAAVKKYNGIKNDKIQSFDMNIIEKLGF